MTAGVTVPAERERERDRERERERRAERHEARAKREKVKVGFVRQHLADASFVMFSKLIHCQVLASKSPWMRQSIN